MLRYKTKTRPGLVALYDIRPGNGAGQFLQPRSPHYNNNSLNKQKTVLLKLLTLACRFVVYTKSEHTIS